VGTNSQDGKLLLIFEHRQNQTADSTPNNMFPVQRSSTSFSADLKLRSIRLIGGFLLTIRQVME